MSTDDEKSRRIRSMFDRIGRRYDLLNHLLSGYSDILWRRSAVRALDASAGDLLLDVGIGTGDLALEALKGKGKPRLIIGVDAALQMMRNRPEKDGRLREADHQIRRWTRRITSPAVRCLRRRNGGFRRTEFHRLLQGSEVHVARIEARGQAGSARAVHFPGIR